MRHQLRTALLFVICFIVLTINCFSEESAMTVRGRIRTPDGKAVPGATVTALTAEQSAISSAVTGADGRFQLKLGRNDHWLKVQAPGFSPRRIAVEPNKLDIDIELSFAPVREEITVTADPGRVEEIATTAQPVNVISREEIELRAKSVTAQVANEEPGLFLQRTSPTIGAVYVRGLTGNKVNLFVDGVRYSNSGQRGGVNTFFNLIDPGMLEAVEVLRGPNSAQYGSDALGGSVQLLTASPVLSQTPSLHGTLRTLGSSADASFGSNASLSYGTSRFGLVGNLTGRRSNRMRPGGGIDSHAAVTRFLGVRSDTLMDDQLPDTAFTQYGGTLKMNWVVAPNSQIVASYMRGQQDGGRRYDQLLGGDGNLVADLRNLMLDLFYVRFDRQRLGWFDTGSLTYSFNSQREERVNQGGNGNPRATINHEFERTTVNGLRGHVDKAVGGHDFLLGAEYYHERVSAPSVGFNPVTSVTAVRRGRVPDNALYRTGGAYLQDSYSLLAQRLRLVGSIRYSAASYRAKASDSPLVGGSPLWPDDSLRADDVTFRAGLVGTPTTNLTLSFNVSRGFRAPHITDLGTLGITGSGFEVAAPDVAGLGGTIGDSAAATAVSTGRPVVQVKPETSLEYDWSARVRTKVVDASVAFFINNIEDNITKQGLILPAGAVGTSLGGQTITAQNANGVVFVAAASTPVLVRANFDDAKLWGFEHRGEVRLTSRWNLGTIFSYVHAEDKRTGLAPNIEGGTPPANGYLKLRYVSGNGRWWIEPYMFAAGRQERLSSLDIEDRRTGATRTRSNIQNFFRNGATARGWVGAGPDTVFGNADDVFLVTGETLAQVQNRVLGVGVNAAPLFTAVAGYTTFNIRGGFRLGERHRITADFSNVADKNYRGISWGVDAPGRNLTLQYVVNF
jgi:hemoglobin/transferrin/lactoferrin receptor protein